MHQYLFGTDNRFVVNIVGLTRDESLAPLLTFSPKVAYDLNDKWNIGLEIPISFWSKVVTWDIGVKPKVTYKLGGNASISGYYKMQALQYDKLFGRLGDTEPPVLIKNTLQVNFEWSF
jgi:hypothetical protein